MNSLYLNIAGFIIKVGFKKTRWEFSKDRMIKEIQNDLKGFIIKKPARRPDFIINFVEKRQFLTKKIRRGETYIFLFQAKRDKKIDTSYNLSINQLRFILRDAINQLLANNHGFILHSSASSINGKAQLFLARSGGGKSTAIKLLMPEYQPLADDSVFVKKEGRQYVVYQTPFIEKEYWINKGSKGYPIDKVFFINKSKESYIQEIDDKKAIFQLIFRQLLTEKEYLNRQTPYIFDFTKKNLFYKLFFTKQKIEFVNLSRAVRS